MLFAFVAALLLLLPLEEPNLNILNILDDELVFVLEALELAVELEVLVVFRLVVENIEVKLFVLVNDSAGGLEVVFPLAVEDAMVGVEAGIDGLLGDNGTAGSTSNLFVAGCIYIYIYMNNNQHQHIYISI